MLYTGVVENRQDPLKLGRCQVRVVGLHTHDKSLLPTYNLPWAYPMQPTTSAAMSGIGESPVGPVEGTWVVVMFQDKEQQQPLILGTLGGIPQEFGAVDQDRVDTVLKDEFGNATSSLFATNNEGEVIRSGEVTETATSTTPDYSGLRPARDFSSVSSEATDLVKQFEELREIAVYDTYKAAYVVGYGTTRIDNTLVTSNRRIDTTKADDYLLADLNNRILPLIKSYVRTLLTQSMVDAIAVFMYNVGTEKFIYSKILSELNSGKYLNAAARFIDYNKASIPSQITPRAVPTFPSVPTTFGELGNGSFARTLSNGDIELSNTDGVFLWNSSQTPIQYKTPVFVSGYRETTNVVTGDITVTYITSSGRIELEYDSTGALKSGQAQVSTYNDTVVASLTPRRNAEKDLFLSDGLPNITGDLSPVTQTTTAVDEGDSESGYADFGTSNQFGFRDPKSKYPLYKDEPDTNRLARHEQIGKTIVFKKESSRLKDVSIANTTDTWDQPRIPYNAQYPFNHVTGTESGHIIEFDDTPNSERIHIYHASGTFTETDANGTQVNRIVGDNVEIWERNGYIRVLGSGHLTVDGDYKVKVDNALDVEVAGAATINIYNDATVNVSGNANMSVLEDFKLKAENVYLEADTAFNIKSNGTMNIESTSAMNINTNSNLRVDYSRGDFGNGAGSATATGLSDPSAKQTPTLPEFSELTVLTRGSETAQTYETPDEGDPDPYRALQLTQGNLPSDEIDTGTVSENYSAPSSTVAVTPVTCTVINNTERFNPSMVISDHFTLGALTKNGTRMPVDQLGVTKQDIVCNLKNLAVNCLEPIINLYPNMVITNAFRRPGDVPGSAARSQHYFGEAADFVLPGYSRAEVFEAIKQIQQVIPYDQLLLEYSGSTTVWVHVSLKRTSNRQMAFTMRDHKRISDIGQYSLVV